ncbi:MAG: efflux RND transporter permease subunit [bacterium]|nr:efflux RND transporter permease subunit [bacterium]
MKLSDLSIRRPVFASVMSLSIVLFGVIAFLRLPVREYPDIDPPVVSVVTLYRGASASVVETEITDILEEQFATLSGVKTLKSASREEGSVITIEFELSREVEEAANDVRERVARSRGLLPRDVEDPVVEKIDANAQPIVWLGLSSDVHDGLQLTEAADRILKDRLQRLPGVGSIIIGGERRYAMRVWLDPQRLAARGLTPSDVEAAIARENAEIPGGRIEGSEREFSVRTRGEVNTPEQFAALIVAQNQDGAVRLGDVATVEIGAQDERTVARYNGKPAVGLGIVKQSKASTIDVARAVREQLPALVAALPAGMRIDIAYDSSQFITESITEVTETIIIAMCLVILVVLAFMKSMRATLIPTLAIPVSIVGTFVVIYFLGFTINILTLLALVLAIGLVVDDAIVVLENIFRHMEMGKSRLRAAFDGTREIAFAVIATTIALVAVFVPVAFLTGSVGRLFREFGFTVAIAVAISGFVALTLTPMFSSRILRPIHGTGQSWAARSFDSFFVWLNNTYERILKFALRHRLATVITSVLLVLISGAIFKFMPSELVPTEDRGIGFGIVLAPEGSTLAYTDRHVRTIESILLPLPERKGLFTATGLGFQGPGRVTDSFMFLNIGSADGRDKSQQAIVGELFPQLFSIPGVLAFVINPPSLGQFSSSPIEYVLQAESYEELSQAMNVMVAQANKLGYLYNVNTDLKLDKPELSIAIDRERAAELGVSTSEIGSTLQALLGGRVISDFKRGSKQYDVIMQVQAAERATPDVIEGIYVRGQNGLVQLANLVAVSETAGPKELNHYNRLRSATLTANLIPFVSLGQALDDLDGVATGNLPPSIRREYAGQSLEYQESSTGLYFFFILALVFIFLVLAAQFESFIHPFTILLSVPLAVFGALVSLFVFGQSLNIYSQIGLIMLIGLVTKNAILIVEFANQLRARGQAIQQAVIEASVIRLRPILMTSFATVFGILPIAIGLGAGAEARRPLGIAVVGGMLFSTFLTLVLVPVVYSLLARFSPVHDPDQALADADAQVTGDPTPQHAH